MAVRVSLVTSTFFNLTTTPNKDWIWGKRFAGHTRPVFNTAQTNFLTGNCRDVCEAGTVISVDRITASLSGEIYSPQSRLVTHALRRTA